MEILIEALKTVGCVIGGILVISLTYVLSFVGFIFITAGAPGELDEFNSYHSKNYLIASVIFFLYGTFIWGYTPFFFNFDLETATSWLVGCIFVAIVYIGMTFANYFTDRNY